MTLKRALLFLIPTALMLIALWGLAGIETRLASFATTQKAYLLFGRIGLTLPFLVSAGLGSSFFFQRAAVSTSNGLASEFSAEA